MYGRLIHIVPFDMGSSFIDLEYSRNVEKKEFIRQLKQEIHHSNFSFEKININEIMGKVTLERNICCYLLSYGIGVFVIEDLRLISEDYFKDSLACDLYYTKKVEQNEILKLEEKRLKSLNTFMNIVWNILPHKSKPFTASPKYKNNGLSYVLTIYCLNYDEHFNKKKDIDLLMNPEIMANILNNEEWPIILDNMAKHKERKLPIINFSARTAVASSWSAVIVLDDINYTCLEKIIKYEVLLQGAWFLYDRTIDLLQNSSFTNIELQRIRSLLSYVSLEISNITSANLSTNQMKAFKQIYSTSGIEIVETKLNKMLENRINIEEAKHKIKQTNYGIITEILLVLFTIINLFNPIKALINNKMTIQDIFIMSIMLIALVLCSIIIIRKEK